MIGTIAFIRGENLYYAACTQPGNSGRACAKKLVQHDGETWFCDRCNTPSTPEWRYILSCQIQDLTGQTWLTAFQVQPPRGPAPWLINNGTAVPVPLTSTEALLRSWSDSGPGTERDLEWSLLFHMVL